MLEGSRAGPILNVPSRHMTGMGEEKLSGSTAVSIVSWTNAANWATAARYKNISSWKQPGISCVTWNLASLQHKIMFVLCRLYIENTSHFFQHHYYFVHFLIILLLFLLFPLSLVIFFFIFVLSHLNQRNFQYKIYIPASLIVRQTFSKFSINSKFT